MLRHFVYAVVLCLVVCLRFAWILTNIARRPQRKHGVWHRPDYQECAKWLPGLGATYVALVGGSCLTVLQRFRRTETGAHLPSKIRSEMRLTMQTTVQTLRTFLLACRPARATIALGLLLILGLAQSGFAQTATNPLNLFQNFFVTGDYVVAGWVEGTPDLAGYATGTITVPDIKQPTQNGVPASVPNGADIVAAYLYWATVEGNQNTYAGQQAYFNGYSITGTILGNPNAPVSWSSGGCSGAAKGSKTMRTYRADVRPYLALDRNTSDLNFGALTANGPFNVRLADSGSNGNTAPFSLGATLVIIYRVLSPAVPLNAIVIYDGAYAPSNPAQNASMTMTGFYQPATNPVAKLTHIVANGQPNKSEAVYLNSQSQPLPSLYSGLPPFPGIYGSWDNPTWVLSQYGYVKTTDTSETTSVIPSAQNSGCVSWGTTILSTTVQDQDGDGLLDVWENNQGYTDAVSGQWVALPGANSAVKDLFIEADYLSNLDSSAGPYKHSHLPKQATLDAVGNAFAAQYINVHFDLGPNIYQGDPYVITNGTGGNAISEGLVLCTDGAALCAFPGQPAIAWKGGFNIVQNDPTLGNFQPGRAQSYHYMLFGHSLGAARSYWSALANTLSLADSPQLVSILNSGTTATITLQTPFSSQIPPPVVKPGDCPNSLIPACSDANSTRITIAGALGQPALNRTYSFDPKKVNSTTTNNITTTIFTVTTAGVASGTYTFNNEPQLGAAYLGPTSTSGHSDFGGGGDSAITLGLWGEDDLVGCQPDPSQPLGSSPAYCNNLVGSVQTQTGTVLHELGHSLTLTHGGTYYNDPNNPSLPTYDLNCKPNYLSVMNYLFQVRGFVDNVGFDYSSQSMPPLNEASLSEAAGIGLDTNTGPATHLTRWYSSPNALDIQLQNTTGRRYSTAHCDGTPLLPSEPPSVRVDGTVASGGNFSAPLDWNNDLFAPDGGVVAEDLDHNGTINGNSPFLGFSDWPTVNLQQMSARENSFGFSGGGGLQAKGGGLQAKGGGLDNDGGGLQAKGGGLQAKGGGTDQDTDTANSTVDAPKGLTCSVPQGNVPGCVISSGSLLENAKSIPLTWTPPTFGQIRKYYVWRAVGSFTSLPQVLANMKLFSNIKIVTGMQPSMPPSPTYIDSNVKNNTTYTYFVTDANAQGVQSATTSPLAVTTKF